MQGIDWVSVSVVDVVFSNEASSIIMKDSANGKIFLIHVSIEMGSILLDLFQKQTFKRPNTFMLLSNCITSLGASIRASIRAIMIDDIYDGVFFAKVIIDHNDNLITLDARPSDAIAISVINDLPILASRVLLDKLSYIDTGKSHPHKAGVYSVPAAE